MARRACAGPRPPEQFQFGARRIRLDFETYAEAYVVVAATGGAGAALSRTQVRPGGVPGTTPPRPDASPMLHPWDRSRDPPRKHHRTYPRSIPRHFRACRKIPKGWHYIDPHRGFLKSLPSFGPPSQL